MLKRCFKTISTVFILLSTLSFTGCIDELLHPTPKCTDEKVIEKLTQLINTNTMYGSKATINEELIILLGTNEKTNMKTCQTKVDFKLENENNSTMINMMNNMPFMSDLSKNHDLRYTISLTEDKKDFIVNIIE